MNSNKKPNFGDISHVEGGNSINLMDSINNSHLQRKEQIQKKRERMKIIAEAQKLHKE